MPQFGIVARSSWLPSMTAAQKSMSGPLIPPRLAAIGVNRVSPWTRTSTPTTSMIQPPMPSTSVGLIISETPAMAVPDDASE